MRREIYNFNYLILSNVSMKIMLYNMIMSYNIYCLNLKIYGLLFIFLKMGFYPFSYIIERLIMYISYEIMILLNILSKWILIIWIEKLKYGNNIEGIIIYNLLIVGLEGIRKYTIRIILWYLILLSSCWFMLSLGEDWWYLAREIYFWSTLIEFYGIYKITMEMDYLIDVYKSREKLIMGIILLSMIGLPPLVGFFTKWWIITINGNMIVMFIGLLGTVICSFMIVKVVSYNIGYIGRRNKDVVLVGWYCLVGLEIVYNLIWIG